MRKSLFVWLLLVALGLGACASGAQRSADSVAPATAGVPEAASESPAVAMGAAPPMDKAAAESFAPLAESGDTVVSSADASSDDWTVAASAQARADRMVIKNADLRLLVADTDLAIDGVTQIAADVGGYIVSSRVWYQDWWDGQHKYAAITLSVPAGDFELAMRRLRGLGLQVLDEQAAGQDVTDEYVDLQSRLDNLEATRDRIRAFLDQAQTVEESLQVNRELSNIEDQIEQIKGRMNYLSQRTSFSSITVNLEPDLPPPPTPTPTLTPTPAPGWSAADTFEQASGVLVDAYRGLASLFIWLLVVVIPVLLPFALVIWLLWRLLRRAGPQAG